MMNQPRRASGSRQALRRLALMLIALLGAGCSEPPPETKEVIRGVLTQQVEGPGASRSRSFTGVARSRNITELSFRVSGKIREIHVRTGDVLDAGTLVAELDPTDFQISLSEARAALAQAKAESRNSDSTYRRIRALYEREGVSRGDLDQARAAAESGEANANAARNRVQQASLQLGYATLRTPSEGAVSAVPADISENIQAGEPVIVFQTGGPPEVEIAMPESLIPNIEVGRSVQIAFSAFPNEPYEGLIREVGIAPESGGSTYPVTVQVNADWDKIRPGMAADVLFVFERTDNDIIVVPTGAVGHDRDGHFVFIVGPGSGPSGEAIDEDIDEGIEKVTDGESRFGMTQRRRVELGEISAEGLEIRSGIKGGERIVVAGVPRIRDQMKVRILREGDWP